MIATNMSNQISTHPTAAVRLRLAILSLAAGTLSLCSCTAVQTTDATVGAAAPAAQAGVARVVGAASLQTRAAGERAGVSPPVERRAAFNRHSVTEPQSTRENTDAGSVAHVEEAASLQTSPPGGAVVQVSHEIPAVTPTGPTPFSALPGTIVTPVPVQQKPGVARVQPVPARVLPLESAVGEAVDFYPHAPRVRIPALVGGLSLPELYPDEYLFDGGDRDYPVHYDYFHRHGLDTEDTVAEYQDHRGSRHLTESTRVAVYAPRFNAVRTVSGAHLDETVNRLVLSRDVASTVGVGNRVALNNKVLNETTDALRLRARPSGLRNKETTEGYHLPTGVDRHKWVMTARQGQYFLKTGNFRQADEAWLAEGILNARVWTHDLNPVIAAVVNGVKVESTAIKADEYLHVKDKKITRGRLQVVKLADRKTAQPGDVIKFTLRFDNVGDHDALNVQIIDNLTPRLAYIEDTGTSTLPGRLDVEDNAEGSLVLKFVLDAPLKGHTGGVITFEARVR